MKRQIRFGVFETNSSSTHSLTMCTAEEYEKWSNGELYFNDDTWWNELDEWVTKEEIIDFLKTKGEYNEDSFDEVIREHGFYMQDEYFDDEYLESFESTYTTLNGEKVVAFGKFGNN